MARIFSAKCRRQLSLNFAAQTASDALNRMEQLVVMRQDWDRFDVDGILDQTLWICDCDANEVRAICKCSIRKNDQAVLTIFLRINNSTK